MSARLNPHLDRADYAAGIANYAFRMGAAPDWERVERECSSWGCTAAERYLRYLLLAAIGEIKRLRA